MALIVQNLCFAYAKRAVLHDVSLNAGNGEIVAIIGPNGSGKTTLVKCLVGLTTARQGTVLLDSRDIHRMSIIERAKAIAYVPQRVEVAGMSVFDFVLLGRRPHISWDVPASDLELTGNIIEYMGLKDLSFRNTDEISGGEFQIAQIARALVQSPRLIALDEPTSNLDIQNQRKVMLQIRSIVKKHGVMAIMTNHDINLSIRYCDRFILLKDGKIHASGSHEIITPRNIKAVYGLDVYVGSINGFPVVVPLEEETHA